MEITLKNKINNISLQVGDKAYYITPGSSSTTPNLIGVINDITEVNGYTVLTINLPINNLVDTDDFIMFSKNRVINNSSLLGYYAEVKLLNQSDEKAELFALGSEIIQSSK